MANISSINGNPIVVGADGISADSIMEVKFNERSIIMDSLGMRVPTYTVIENSAISPNGSVATTSNTDIYDQIYLEAGETLVVRGNVGGSWVAIAETIVSGESYNPKVNGGGINNVITYAARAAADGYYAVTHNKTGGAKISIAICKYDLSKAFDVLDILTVSKDSKEYTNQSTDFDDVYENKYAIPSGLIDGNSYVSYGFEALAGGSAWFEQTESTYVSIVAYSSKTMTSGIRYRKNGSEDTLPYENSPLSIEKGWYYVISVTYSSPEFALHIDGYNYIDTFNPNIKLAESHVNQVISEIGEDISGVKKLSVKYVNGSGPHDSTERVEVYVPSANGYVMYNFVHTVKESVNADVWRVYEAAAYTNAMTRSFAMTTGGEWEMAIHLAGRDDFSGGFMHGDEIMTSIVFLADGLQIDVTELTDAIEVGELRVVQASDVYDPNDHETVYATHGSEHLFNRSGLLVTQSVEWLLDETVSGSYLAMFPAAKTVVDKFYTDSNAIVEDIAYGEQNDTKAVMLLGDNGVMMRFSIEYLRGTALEDYILLITDNNGGQYHKCYYYANKTSASITAGTVWKSKTAYELSIGGTL